MCSDDLPDPMMMMIPPTKEGSKCSIAGLSLVSYVEERPWWLIPCPNKGRKKTKG